MKQEKAKPVSKEEELKDMLNEDKRLESIMKTLSFTNKILVMDDGQMVITSRVVLPEHHGKVKLTKRVNPDEKDPQKNQ